MGWFDRNKKGKEPQSPKGERAQQEQQPNSSELFSAAEMRVHAQVLARRDSRFRDDYATTQRDELAKKSGGRDHISGAELGQLADLDLEGLRARMMATVEGVPSSVADDMRTAVTAGLRTALEKKSEAGKIIEANTHKQNATVYFEQAAGAQDLVNLTSSWTVAERYPVSPGMLPAPIKAHAVDRFVVSAQDGSQLVCEMMHTRRKHDGQWYEQYFARPVSVLEAVPEGSAIQVGADKFDGVVVVAQNEVAAGLTQDRWKSGGDVGRYALSADKTLRAPGGLVQSETLIDNALVDSDAYRVPAFMRGGNIAVAQDQGVVAIYDRQKGHQPDDKQAVVFVRRRP